MGIDRRQFMKYATASGALAALPLSVQRAIAASVGSGSLASVAHVVILSQENRAFDHYLGSLNGVRGYNDPHPLRLPDGSSVFAQKNASNQAIWPFRLNSKTTNGQCMVDVTHDWTSGRNAFNGGQMDKWIPNKGNYAMGYYTREDIPFHYALSDAFTTCDHFFCSSNTSTNPNRLFLMSGSNGQGLWASGAQMDNSEAIPFTWTTYAERLQTAGISWKMYQEQDNYDDNALAWFSKFKSAATTSPLYQNGMVKRTRDAFAKDVAADSLPAVSWIIAPAALSEHPAHEPNAGANYAKIFLDALASNPAVWAKTVFIYTYDENGGIFDHVVPPTAPVGTVNEWKSGYPLGLGHRMPTWLISPWSIGGYVYSQACDLTSVIRFLEKFTGVQEPNISAWRRSVCGDLMDGFDFTASGYGYPTTIPDTTTLASDAAFACANLPAAVPNGEASAPAVESGGSRPLRPVAVQPSVDAVVDPATKKITLQLANMGAQAAAFNIHGYNTLTFSPIFVTVPANGTQSQVIDATAASNGRFDLAIHGPNSFYRRFAGSILANAWQNGAYPQVSVTPNLAGGSISITIQNRAAVALSINIDDYLRGQRTPVSIAANASATFTLATVNNWYDVMLLIVGDTGNTFVYEYCGHIEGGISQTFPGRIPMPGTTPVPTASPAPTATPVPVAGFTTALLTGLTHYYRTDSTVVDEVGAANLNTVGAVGYVAAGKFASALQLDATQGIAAFMPFEMSSAPFTLGFWVKMPSNMGANMTSIVANKDWATGKNAGISIGHSGDGRFKFNIGDGTNRADGYLAMVTGAWVYVAIAVDPAAKTMRCYASNASGTVAESVLSFSNVTGNIVPSYKRWALNEDARGDYYKRYPKEKFVLAFDDIAVWNRALPAAEIRAIAAASQPLQTLRISPTATPAAAPAAMAVNQCATAWQSATTYAAGSIVSDAGRNYQAKWISQGERPSSNSGSALPWQDLGACQ
ncbi:phospholipase C, phosphocholine-specific [Chitinibacter bivalviorum]|uniref:phospholipase C n=1 Tax=Chitinibacter bivalviorum TaxID=2739434 RepID=A0A7H9BEG8_9NEIS|nr:phospholipase C, phosphocholine-specific [Chitinibacter bivalviorum]QLG86842.1 phospholipase C, phosphocholine-specific [Chitinibacter bivalviorum]